jgi:uncharacterized protein (TIGR04255 family)
MKDTRTLGNKPLVEAIFEVRWELKTQSNGLPNDPLYDVMVGDVRRAVQEIFPNHVRLQTVVPGIAIPYQVQHQFRAGPEGWPVMQLGPGVLTVNETAGYLSGNFIPLCVQAMNVALKFWANNSDEAVLVNQVSLRYIDADVTGPSIFDFLNKLGLSVRFEPRLFAASKSITAEPTSMQINTTFAIPELDASCALIFTKAKKEGSEDALIWETHVAASGTQCEVFSKSPTDWLEAAHDVAHDVFFAMIKGELEEKYK